mmetsp:Transcript_96545/g.251610  ORF Transcript_96545/g.251610 Transcript_96545/m.251610 type:complete len:208 (+) Transcript_96545:235-858(+)
MSSLATALPFVLQHLPSLPAPSPTSLPESSRTDPLPSCRLPDLYSLCFASQACKSFCQSDHFSRNQSEGWISSTRTPILRSKLHLLMWVLASSYGCQAYTTSSKPSDKSGRDPFNTIWLKAKGDTSDSEDVFFNQGSCCSTSTNCATRGLSSPAPSSETSAPEPCSHETSSLLLLSSNFRFFCSHPEEYTFSAFRFKAFAWSCAVVN